MEKIAIQNDDVFLIKDFLSAEECKELIAQSESIGFSLAPITTATGFELNTEVRNNTRVISDNPELAAKLFGRALPFLPERIDFRYLAGFNERWRFYRYDPGQKFAPHYDGAFRRNDDEVSKLTFMLYLNEHFHGGSTRFYHNPDYEVRPVRGTALVFTHRRLHEGAPVLSGRKYVLRTDVMYTRVAARIA